MAGPARAIYAQRSSHHPDDRKLTYQQGRGGDRRGRLGTETERFEGALLKTSRPDQLKSFLEAAGWSGAKRRSLAGDASFRRYDRVTLGPRKAVLMDALPDKEDIRPFLTIAKHLRSLGYSAPEIFAEAVKEGFILLEDLGDTTFTHRLQSGMDENPMYERAIDFLIDLHSRNPNATVPAGLPMYDTERYLDEAFLLTDWYMPHVSERSDAARRDYESLWREILPGVFFTRDTLVLRDFHADNLMWLPERVGVAACGLLDFQDAVAGPPAYDLMSLLEDARRDVPPDLGRAMINRYLTAFPEIDKEAFTTSFNILAAQRHCKVIGIFTRLALRDNKAAYLTHIPRVWRLLDRACTVSKLAPLKSWLEKWLPAEKRNLEVVTSQK